MHQILNERITRSMEVRDCPTVLTHRNTRGWCEHIDINVQGLKVSFGGLLQNRLTDNLLKFVRFFGVTRPLDLVGHYLSAWTFSRDAGQYRRATS